MAESSTPNKIPTDDTEGNLNAFPSSSTESTPDPAATSPVKQGRQGKNMQKVESPAQSSTPDSEETKQALKSKVSAIGETIRELGQVTGCADSSEFQSSHLLPAKEEIDEESQMNRLPPSRESSQAASDESLLDTSHEKEVTREEGGGGEDEVVSTPKKRKSSRPPKASKCEGGTTKRKRRECSVGEEADDMDYDVVSTPKKRKPGRPPKKSMQDKDDADTDMSIKGKKLDANISRIPGTKLKICSHCGTVADKVKAKKCYRCKKFFFSHWAQRCKIPPCPNCHFSRKSRRFERIPSNCEKCGFKLPSELLDESTGSYEDGDGVESLGSGSTSVRYTPDPSEFDNLSNEWSASKQMGEEPDDEYLDAEEEEEYMMEEVVVEKKGKGKAKGDRERAEVKNNSPEVEQVNATRRTGSVGPEGVIVVTATTRSGRAYKHDTTPEPTYGSFIAGGYKTDTPFLKKNVAHEDVPPVLGVPSSQHKGRPPSQRVKCASTPPFVKDLTQESDHTQHTNNSDQVKGQEVTPQAPLRESLSTSKQSLVSETTGTNISNQEVAVSQTRVHLSPAQTHSTVPSCEHTHLLEKKHVEQSSTPVENMTQNNTAHGCAAEMRMDRETQVAVGINQPEGEAVKPSLVPVVSSPSREEGNRGTMEAQAECSGIVSMKSRVVSGAFRADEAESNRHSDLQHSTGTDSPLSTPLPFTQNSAVQTVSGDIIDDTGEEGSSEGDRSVFRNINKSLPFLRSVLGGLNSPVVHTNSSTVRAQSVPAMGYTHTADSSTTTTASQNLPVFYTSSIGLEGTYRSRVDQATFSGESNLVATPLSYSSVCKDHVSTIESIVATTTPSTATVISAPTAMEACDRDADMVVTESGTLTIADTAWSEGTGSNKHNKAPTTQKASKGKKVGGKDGKSTAVRKKRQPKSQEKKEGTGKEKSDKPKKPRAKKSKSMTASAPSVSDEASTAAISMLATSIAQELQRKPSLSSPLVAGQHSKHSFSQYFYSEDAKPSSSLPGSYSSASGSRGSDTFPEGGSERSSTKRSPGNLKDSHEPPIKKKKLANIAPNAPLTSTANSTGSAMGPQSLRATLGPLMTPALLPQLYQLAATFKMSSSNLLSVLQSVLPPQKSNGNSSSGVNPSGVIAAPSSAPNPSSLTPNLFPPLTMSFQSLAAALSNMPIATAPIRLSGTQVTARPLLPSTMTSAAPSLSVTASSSLPSVFPSLGAPNISNEQLATLKGVLAQSEASVGTQTAVKIDTLKSLIPAGPSSLSPQLLTLPNPPQLTSAPMSSSSLPPPPPSFVPKDLKPAFQSVLSNQLPSAPPPLTSSHPIPHTSTPRMSAATSAVPFPVIQSHTTSTSYMTLPMNSGATLLPFLPAHSSVIPLPRRGAVPSQMTSSGDDKVQPLLISSLPESTSQPLSVTPGSVLPPPPNLLPQSHDLSPSSSSSPHLHPQSYVLDSMSESATGDSLSLLNPIIPSLLRPETSPAAMSKVDRGAVSGLPQHPFTQQKVIYTQSITSPKVCPGPQPTSVGTPSVDSNLQVLASNVQSRISEALSKANTENKSSEPHPLLPATTATMFPLAPPPLTPSIPITFVSKGSGSSHPQYILPHPPPQKKRGVVITRLSGPLSSAFSHTGELRSREGSRHSSTSSLKGGDDPSFLIQNAAAGTDAVITGFSSPQPTVITLSPSPTDSLEEQHQITSADHRKHVEHDSDKESDSYAKLMSEETLASDPSSDGEGVMREDGGVCDGAGDHQHNQSAQSSSTANEIRSKKGGKKGREKEREGRDGDDGGRGANGDKGKGSKKRRKSSSGGSGKKSHMFSVKLKDCFLHHLTWMDYRMVLLVPLGDKQKHKHKHKQQHDRHKQQQIPHQQHSPEAQTHSSAVKLSAGGGKEGGGGGGGGGERRRRRKPVLKELSGYNDMEEDDDDASQSTTSSLHVPGPCFSVYELRNKLFQTLSPNAVYIYTYKNQIKSFKLPIHWVYILKRMGGMLDSCHTCRLMDLEHVRGMCSHYGLSLPDTLNSLCRNELPKGRKVIDLSSIEPESLGPLHLEEIPPCSFTEKGRPYKPKTKKSKKKWRKEEEHRGRRKSEYQEKERSERKSSGGGDHREVKEQDDSGNTPQASTSSLPMKEDTSIELEEEEMEGEGGEREGEEDEERGARGEEQEQHQEGEMEEEGEMVDEWAEEEKEWKKELKYGKRSPPPLIKHSPSLIFSSRAKKKPCPYCGAQVLKRSKKCSVCNRNFGIYTFGRRQCLFCGRVNLARMARCNECGQSLDKAPSARPKDDEGDSGGASSSHKKSDFIFGIRKRRKVHSVPLAFSGSYQGYMSSKTRKSSELLQSPGHSGHVQTELTAEEEMEEGEREEGEEEEEGVEGGVEGGEEEEEAEEEEEEEVLAKKPTDTETAKQTPKYRMKSSSSVSTKHASYRYGHIPWADADITVLVDERGIAKFCLQELIAKVLVGHTKAEVFEMVRDLDLPLEQGNVQLLKKLQALGLHANRSPMCKLIAAEELWLLLDALQEPVPEEVHQHLENINTSTTPLLSPGGAVRSPAVVASAPVTNNPEEEEQQTTSFDSTLHEMQCSDGQYISVLRKWNGEQFACLPEIWRKYFPEVNRNHLSSALRRLMLETHMPTGQQATLLRSAQVISIRGAPGRLMKLEDMQTLLDDFCIPLQLATGHTQKHSMSKAQKPPALTASAPKPVSHRPVGRPRVHSSSSHPTASTALPHGKVLADKEDVEYAKCMRHVLTAVHSSDLVALLQKTRLTSEMQADTADSEAAELDSELDRLGQLIHSRRGLSTVLSREMGFLNASVHGYMSEVVRLSHAEKLVLQNLDSLLHSMNLSLL